MSAKAHKQPRNLAATKEYIRTHYVPLTPSPRRVNLGGVNINENIAIVNNVASKVVSQGNPGRRSFEIQNRSLGAVYMRTDTTADADSGIQISAGGSYTPEHTPIGSIHMIGTLAADQRVIILEGF